MIDFHTHIFPEKIADKTIAYLSSICKMAPYTNGKLEGLLASMDQAGIERSVLLPVVTAPAQFESVNQFALQFQEGRLISFAGIHPKIYDYKEKLRWIKENGFLGIKLHPDYQDTYFNDMQYKRLIEYASELDLIVVTHAGRDPYSPSNVHCTPELIAEVVREVAPSKLVLAHMGGNEMLDKVEELLVGKEIYLDTSYVLDKISKEQFVRMVRNHGADKILFATDSPWAGQKELVTCFRDMGFTPQEEEKILQKNAEKLLKIS